MKSECELRAETRSALEYRQPFKVVFSITFVRDTRQDYFFSKYQNTPSPQH